MLQQILRRCVLILLLMAAPVWAEMPRMELFAGMFRIEAEVAHTDANRQLGLMHRRSMAPQHGMLFVFAQQARHCMWMRNTFIPLSVAFMDDDGRVINIADMTPQDETAHCSAKPARYALEMNQGWFASRKFKPGDKIRGIEHAPAPR